MASGSSGRRKRGPGGSFLLALSLSAGCGSPSGPPSSSGATGPEIFADASAGAGLDFVHMNGMSGELFFAEMMGGGAALFDADGDGDLDLYLVQGRMLTAERKAGEAPPTDRLYRNEVVPAGELRFTDVTEESGLAALAGEGYGMGVAAGDYDGDGRVDLYVTCFGPNRLLKNEGGTFTDVTREAGVGDERWSVAAAFFDYDRDGRLDLYVGNYVDFTLGSHKPCYDAAGARDYCAPSVYRGESDRLFRNRGDGTFADVGLTTGVGTVRGAALGAVAADFDGDGWLDLYVANDGEPNFLWRNRRDGTFEDTALMAGAAVDEDGRPQASMGVDAADFDGDGDEDLFMSHLTGESNALYENLGSGELRDATAGSGLGSPSLGSTGFGTAFLDFDNDGRLDLLVANGAVKTIEALAAAGDPYPLHQRNQVFHNLGNGRFEEVTERAGAVLELSEVSRGAAFGDVDDDGDTDVVVVNNNGPARLLINQVGSSRSWIGLRLVAGHRDALGARVEVSAPGRPGLWRRSRSDGSYASASDPRVLVGLGDFEGEVGVRVFWVDGEVESWSGLATRRYHALRQGTGERATGERAREPRVHTLGYLRPPLQGSAGKVSGPPVSRPDLGRVEEAVRRQLETKAEEVAALDGTGAEPGRRAEAWGELGRLYHAYDFLDAAGVCYDNARTLAPDDFRWPYYLGFLHQVRGELEPAAERFREALARRADDPAALLRLGEVLLELDRPAEARPLFERVLTLDPTSAAAHHGLGKVAARGGDFAAAAERFERTLELQPEATLVHYPLAQAYRALGDRERAEAHLRQRGNAGPTFPDPLVRDLDAHAVGAGLRLTRAGVALAEGRRDAAMAEYRLALAADPDNAAAHLALGQLLAQAGDGDEAIAHLDRAVELDPRQPAARLARAAALVDRGDLAGARRDLDQLLASDPDDARAHLRLGEVLQRLGDAAAAEHYARALEAGLEGPGERAAAHLSLGNLLAGRRDDEAAAGHYRAALELAPDLAEAHFNLAGVLGRLGDREGAIVHYRQVVELRPEDVAARLYLAQDLAATGRYGEARERLEAALAAFPENGAVAHTLARLLAACPDPSLRDGPRALELALAVLESQRERPRLEHAETVAMAFAETGRFEEAVKWQREVIAAAERAGDPRTLDLLRRNLARYERGKPCCARTPER